MGEATPAMKFQLGGSFRKPTSGFLPPGKPKTILRSFRPAALNIVYEGKNLTPKQLNPEVYRLAKERQLGVYGDDGSALSWKESSSTAGVYDAPKSTLRFKTEMGDTTVQGSVFRAGSGFEAALDVSIPTELTVATDTRSETSQEVDIVKSIDSLEGYEMQKAPTHVSLILSETNTNFILDIPSCTALKDTEEGDLVEQLNQEYEYLTEGKGRNRKVVNAEAQTVHILKKSRNTEAEFVQTINRKAFASNWEMFDTFYNEKDNETEPTDNDSNESDEDTVVNQTPSAYSIDSYRMPADEKQIIKLMKNPKFQEAVCVIERLLANNCFNEQQKRFRGLSDPSPFREDIEYKYRLDLLWTFANSYTKGRCVTALEWNPSNKDLIAVGYGKFYFSDNLPGMVMVWNIKNPVQPERTYNFPDSVTTLSFSTKDPNMLCVGFYNGYVCVINIASRVLNVLAENVPSFEAVWSVVWRANMDTTKGTEQICAASDDGRVIFYTIENTKLLQAQQMMRVAKADGKLKGYNTMRKCSNLNIPVSRYAGARFIRWHPDDPNIYLVGTNEGVVHKCSTNYLNQHLDLFLAHDGPINDLKYSPFSKKIYATCGDDWHLRIWAEGISEPLHELFVTMMSVQAMDWSPTHSTILATIYGKTILLWDFQRKVWKPQSETQSPTGSRNTIVQFIDSGRCLVVGDIDGNVHVFSLEDMPFQAFFQENLLFEALEKSLMTNPNLMEKVRKLRRTALGVEEPPLEK
ncbi:dynein axonemal intermediate chain 4-like [Anthonomus grandis grandis]|uniref:dynein axonemal intermediate chain 4-like n=1 Tax=Anthonomus grandis grandis TaxID=2921223 RepID=UPI002166A665|nr:dynein axonemal intermediate chain 4-like [Anthonomus grandis grandis]